MADSIVDLEFVEGDESVAVLTLDDGKANAVSPTLIEEMNAALDQAEQENCTLVITGRPGRFSAGFDLSVMSQGGAAMGALVADGAKLAMRLLTFPQPVVLACSGHALAMGALLCLSCDYRIGVEGEFKIGLNEVAIGMTMPWFGVHLAEYRLTPAYFNRGVSNAEVFTPENAVAAGYLDQLVPSEQLLETAVAVAKGMSGLNMSAHLGTKLRVRHKLLEDMKAGLESEFGDFV